MRAAGASVLLAASAGLAGCGQGVQAPTDAGVCWHMVFDAKGQSGGRVSGKYRFFPLERNVADLEHCAAALDAMRIRFLGLGGSQHEVTGVYQGEYLFIDQRGVFAATALDAPSFPTLRRTDDGRLVPPSARTSRRPDTCASRH